MAGILICDQIQNSSKTLLISTGALAANTVGSSQLAPNSVESYLNTQGTSFGFRNRIINGAIYIINSE